MPQDTETDHESDKITDEPQRLNGDHALLKITPVIVPVRLRWILGVTGTLLTVLLIVSVFSPYLSERIKFFTVNALSICVLAAIVVQAYIYRRQWEVMERQFSAFESQTAQSEWQFRQAQQNASDIQRQMLEQSEAMKGQLAAIEKQAGFMETQSQIMADSLAETRKIVEHNEKVFEATRQYSTQQMAVLELQADIAEIQTKVADRTAAAAEKSTLVVGEVPTLYVVWHNGGQTPAFRFRANVYLVFGDKPEWRGYSLNDDFSDSKANFIPPGISGSPTLYPQSEYGFKPITKEFLEDLNGGSKRLYAMVSAVYLDFTDDIRPFKSFYIFNPFEGTFTDLYEYGAENQN